MSETKPVDIAINGRFLKQPTTGVQRVARELTREIDRIAARGERPIRTRLLCQPGADAGDLELQATDVVEVPGPSGHLWEQTALSGAVGESRLLCLGNTAPLRLLLQERPVALMIHDLSYRVFPQAYRRRYRLSHAALMPSLLRRADPIITVSETEKAMLSTLVPSSRERIVVAQNGGWRDQGKAWPRRAEGVGPRPYALYVGSLSQRKNFGGALEVAIRLAREEGLGFVFVGSTGPILSPTRIDVPADVAGTISFAGQVEDLGTLADLYRNACCLVFPSFYEASPLPPMEAMHFGCPVVASAIPSMQERCGDAAEYCDPASVASIVAAVRRVIHMPGRAETLIERGYARQLRYSWHSQALAVIDAMLSR